MQVGRSYQYKINVTNISKNLVLDDVTIRQTKAKGFSIEESEPKFKDGDDGSAHWQLSKLAPGDSKTITVTAQADEEGDNAGCIQADYKAALCLTTRFVKPDLKITKRAPEQVDLCDALTYRYTVENTGSGVARKVKLRDDLDDGLATEDGKKSVAVRRRRPRSRQVPRIHRQADAPTRPATSPAVPSPREPTTSRHTRTSRTPRFVRSKLAVDINGPESMYVNQPMTYQIHVKNEGGASARDTRLQVEADRASKLVRTSKSAPGDTRAADQRQYDELESRHDRAGPRR